METEIKVVMIFKVAVGHLPRKMADNFLRNVAEQVGKTFEDVGGLKLLYIPTKDETDVYAIPLKAFMDGNISGDKEDINKIVERCKTILKGVKSNEKDNSNNEQ